MGEAPCRDPAKDGKSPQPTNKRALSPLFIEKVKPQAKSFLVWDAKQRGLALSVQPSGQRSFKVIYSHHGRARWYHLGDARGIGLADARKLATRVMFAVAEGRDPQAERKAERSAGSFEELARRYVNEHAKAKNKSWRQADALVTKHLLPRWGKLRVGDIARADVKAAMAHIAAPIVANQVLKSASAIFSWAIKEEIIKENPCRLVERHEVRSRERVLSDTEVPKFWAAFDEAGLPGTALKLILLTGQRPGEVRYMRREHMDDGWWEMPGEPVPALGWPGTKNGANHRVWLPLPAQKLIKSLAQGAAGFVLASSRGKPLPKTLATVMREICGELGIADRVTPHDLRRTHGTTITSLGFGRDAMNRVQNHREGGIGSVYDRYEYAEENKRVMEATAARIMALAETNKVLASRKQRSRAKP